MKDLEFCPVFEEIVPTVRGLKSSVMYFGIHFSKKLLLIKHEPLTLMLVFRDHRNEILIPEFVKVVSSRDNQVKEGVKIVANGNLILLLDIKWNLWKLVNAFETLNPDEEHLHSLDSQKYYEWSPFEMFQFEKTFQVTGSHEGFICIGMGKNTEKKLRWLNLHYSAQIQDSFYENLNEVEPEDLFLKTIQINIDESLLKNELVSGKEALILSNKNTGETFICTIKKKHLLNVSFAPLLNVVGFDDHKCLLLALKNGKLIFILYDQSKKHLTKCVLFLSKKLNFIERCNICQTCLIWSDGFNLHHTNLKFQCGKPYFVKPIHLKVNFDIQGIFSIVSVNRGFVAVTFNYMYYQIYEKKSVIPVEIRKSVDELVQEIYEGGLKMNKLNVEIKISEDFLKSKQLIQSENWSDVVELSSEKNYVTLKSKIKKVFSRNYWKISLRARIDNKEIVQTEELEVDFAEGMTIKINSDLITKGEVFVNLVGDYGSDYDLLFAPLGKVGEPKENLRNAYIAKIIQQIAEKRNPYLKK